MDGHSARLAAVEADSLTTALRTPAAQALLRRLEQGGVVSCGGVPSSAQPFLAAILRRAFPRRTIVVVTNNLKAQESFQQDLETWTSGSGIPAGAEKPSPPGAGSPVEPAARPDASLFYPAWEILPHEAKLPHADVISERLEALIALAALGASERSPAPLVVTTVAALMQRTFKPEVLRERTRVVRRGDSIDPLDLVEWLEAQCYEPEAQVTQKGEMSLRGGIIDLYPLTSPWPVRLEFFGNELESLRYFDPGAQTSLEQIDHLVIPPAGELGILQRLVRDGEAEAVRRKFGGLWDYLPPQTIFLLCEPEQLDEAAEHYRQQIPENDPFFIGWEEWRECFRAPEISTLEVTEPESTEEAPDQEAEAEALEPVGETGAAADLTTEGRPDEIALGFSSLESHRPLGERAPDPQIAEAQRREFFAQLHRWLRQGYQVRVFCNNDGESQRFREIWREYGFDPAPGESGDEASAPPSGQPLTQKIHVDLGALARGFVWDQAKLVVVSDAEIFGRYKIQRPRRLKSPRAAAIKSALAVNFTELTEGDYVVHLQHGIGRYAGLKNLPVAAGTRGVETSRAGGAAPITVGQECLVIEYAPSEPGAATPKLYVPVTEAHLVGKYVGAGKAHPPLNTLGGTRWAKAKAQAERAVHDLAADFLAIQAARESQPGHAFGPDTPWQREFESAFIYEETPDQARAITASKGDMEQARPMDRLICGDVGFGKTEVAIRTAFKAVMGGKQVAVLVPTTVLAQQHFNTFRERMADYPVRVELLSRFRSKKELAVVIQDLAAGAVDIVVGTHRLVQPDIAFKDLGLVVIDEEQRFGVLHKEKFKQLRRLVDVLTLSATPIPRTLYLALTGARDMSTIETPPQDRLPVETVVSPYDERLIRTAIQRELNRQGQVFFLHNRVETIGVMQQRLQALVPEARIVAGHGQMPSDELEKVMTTFINGEADVLLSTTIIESGLDIPNANTIIIDRADRFGLSDLYQLRGRVGRYKHQAFAYLLLPRHAGLLSDARKRIQAIKQYSTLGSGFKIAMRDLEIRGAGNLLGAEQSGHITAVGFELYCQLLKQSVAALKGEVVKPRVEVQVRLDFLELNVNVERAGKSESGIAKSSACIPLNYVPGAQHRVDIYRKLAQATDKPSLDGLRAELRDRFGPLPPSVELLCDVAELKILAAKHAITIIETKEDKLMLTRHDDFITLGGKFPRLTKPAAKGRVKEIKKLLLAL